MTAWEYHYVHTNDIDFFDSRSQALGAEGWELVSSNVYYTPTFGSKYFANFKRAIETTKKENCCDK